MRTDASRSYINRYSEFHYWRELYYLVLVEAFNSLAYSEPEPFLSQSGKLRISNISSVVALVGKSISIIIIINSNINPKRQILLHITFSLKWVPILIQLFHCILMIISLIEKKINVCSQELLPSNSRWIYKEAISDL